VEQERGFHFRADPAIRMFGVAFPFDFQSIVHAFDAGQAFHRVLGQGFMGAVGDSSRQGDDAILGFGFDRIVLEVRFEHIGLFGG
jgi:hypothetical protein